MSSIALGLVAATFLNYLVIWQSYGLSLVSSTVHSWTALFAAAANDSTSSTLASHCFGKAHQGDSVCVRHLSMSFARQQLRYPSLHVFCTNVSVSGQQMMYSSTREQLQASGAQVLSYRLDCVLGLSFSWCSAIAWAAACYCCIHRCCIYSLLPHQAVHAILAAHHAYSIAGSLRCQLRMIKLYLSLFMHSRLSTGKELHFVSAGKKSRLAQTLASICDPNSMVNLELVCWIMSLLWKLVLCQTAAMPKATWCIRCLFIIGMATGFTKYYVVEMQTTQSSWYLPVCIPAYNNLCQLGYVKKMLLLCSWCRICSRPTSAFVGCKDQVFFDSCREQDLQDSFIISSSA